MSGLREPQHLLRVPPLSLRHVRSGYFSHCVLRLIAGLVLFNPTEWPASDQVPPVGAFGRGLAMLKCSLLIVELFRFGPSPSLDEGA